jgi:hypothetical protein
MAEKIDKDIQDEIRDPKIRKAVQAARNDRLKAMAAKAREEKGAMAAMAREEKGAMAAMAREEKDAMAAKAREEKGFAKGGMISRLWKKGKNR